MENHDFIHNSVPLTLFQAQDKTPHECTFVHQSDVSSVCNFGWCEWVHYRHHSSLPESDKKLGRILGPCKNDCNEMSQSIFVKLVL